MKRALPLLIVLATACSDGAPIPEDELLLRVTADAQEVELGKAFPLTVVRVWTKGWTPAVWSDDLLAPLVVKLVETTRRENEERVEETRRYDGYAFSLGDVTVPPLSFRAKPYGGGAERSVSADALELKVERALDPATPGAPELPEPPPAPFPWLTLAISAVVAAAALFLLLTRRGRQVEAPAPAPLPEPPPGPHVRALERLARLRDAQPETHDEFQTFYVEASGLLRDYVGERFELRTAEMTTHELLIAHPSAGLGDVLRAADLVKFARARPGGSDRERTLATAETFIRETA